jgi:hypothetical protein
MLLPYTVLLRVLSYFLHDLTQQDDRGLLSNLIISNLEDQSFLANSIAILLLFFEAVMVNRLIIRHRLTHEMSLFGGVFYILIMSLFPSYGGLSSILIANLFLLIALSQLFTTHKKLQSASRIFSVGFWLAISSLFYFGYFPLLLFGLVGLSSLRTMRSKDWLQYFFGYAAPFICLGMVSYLTVDSLALPVAHFSDYFGFLDVSFNSDIISWIEIGLFSGLILLSLINYSNFNLKKGIHAQKKIDLHFWLLFFSLEKLGRVLSFPVARALLWNPYMGAVIAYPGS